MSEPISNTTKVEQALGDLCKLPLLPGTAQQAMALANDDASNLHEFSRLVEQDVTLATSILKLANSPIFSWGRAIESIDQAVVRLGLRECQNLMMAVSMGNLFKKSDAPTKAYCAVLWKHCFMTACLCRRLNQELRTGFQGEEFTAGLLHDLGRILLAVTVPKEAAQADPLDFKEDSHTLERERAILHTDHCQVGFTYAQQNRLPDSAAAAVRYHHTPAQAADHRAIVQIVATADHMTNYLQRDDKSHAYELAGNLGYEDMARGWSADKIAEFKRLAPRLLQETTKAVENAGARRARAEPRPISKDETSSTFWGSVKSWLG